MRTTAADQTNIEVPLDNGTCWRGTEAELRRDHPDWLPYARIAHSSVLTHIEALDFQDDPRPGRLPNSSVKYTTVAGQKVRLEMRPNQTIPRRASATPPSSIPTTEDIPQARRKPKRRGWFRSHPVLWLGVGMLAMLALWQAGITVGTWWQNKENDWMYTQAFRTFSIDKPVGHNGDSAAHPSHFIVQNDNRRIIIIEFPANDVSKAVIYPAPLFLIGDGQDKTPATLSFQPNPQTNKIDMVLHVEDQQYIFANNGTKFVPPSV